MKAKIIKPRKSTRNKSTVLSHSPVLGTLELLNNQIIGIRQLLKVSNNPDAIVELTKLAIAAHLIAHVTKSLF